MERDIYTSITELAAVYETLNKSLESDPCATDAYQVYRQRAYRDACAALRTMPVEPIALRLIAEGISDQVLIRLRDLIRANIHICETRKKFFRQVCFGDLCKLQEDYLFARQRTSLLNDRKLIEEYPYSTEQERKELLRENRTELNKLDTESDTYRRKNAVWISRDYYAVIYDISRFSNAVLDHYFPIKREWQQQPLQRQNQLKSLPMPRESLQTKFSDRECSTNSANWSSDWLHLEIWTKS